MADPKAPKLPNVDVDTIASYPIYEGIDGRLYYFAYRAHGQNYGWPYHYINRLRQQRHAHNSRLGDPAHPSKQVHHATHSHRRHLHTAGNSKPATHSAPVRAAQRSGAPQHTAATSLGGNGTATPNLSITVESPTRQESGDWTESLSRFEKQHSRAILATQGVIDLVAGPASIATTVGIALALAPETGGLSLILAAGVTLYGITRGSVQTAAGLTEVTTAALGNKESVESVSEGMDKVKTLTSISGFITLGVQQARHGRLTEDDWTAAGVESDAENILTGHGMEHAFDAASESLRLSSRVTRLMKLGTVADYTDKGHAVTKDSLKGAHWAKTYLQQQNEERKRKAEARQPVKPAVHSH